VIPYLKLCLVTHQDRPWPAYQRFIEATIEGGITSIQLREKSKNSDEVRRIATALLGLLSPYSIPLIINDDACLAKEIGAHGVHLGQDDLPPSSARKLLGKDKIIGLSVESLDQLHKANQTLDIDYVAASAIFPSQSKKNCKMLWGLAGLRQFTTLAKHPVIAIGGINQENVSSVIEHGAQGVAVIAAIHNAQQAAEMTKNMLQTINRISL
jgi:thiamine-phosphate pyrophosphorylase